MSAVVTLMQDDAQTSSNSVSLNGETTVNVDLSAMSPGPFMVRISATGTGMADFGHTFDLGTSKQSAAPSLTVAMGEWIERTTNSQDNSMTPMETLSPSPRPTMEMHGAPFKSVATNGWRLDPASLVPKRIQSSSPHVTTGASALQQHMKRVPRRVEMSPIRPAQSPILEVKKAVDSRIWNVCRARCNCTCRSRAPAPRMRSLDT